MFALPMEILRADVVDSAKNKRAATAMGMRRYLTAAAGDVAVVSESPDAVEASDGIE